MRLIVCLAVLLVVVEAVRRKSNPLKTKKYKCVPVGDDEEIVVIKKKGAVKSSLKPHWDRAEEELKPIGSARLGKPISAEDIEMPTAHKVKTRKIVKPPPQVEDTLATPPPNYPADVKKDKEGRPLILSPEHCKQVQHYANMYGVKDVLKWVDTNCSFAKMYLPGATCEEINILVASCYRNKYL